MFHVQPLLIRGRDILSTLIDDPLTHEPTSLGFIPVDRFKCALYLCYNKDHLPSNITAKSEAHRRRGLLTFQKAMPAASAARARQDELDSFEKWDSGLHEISPHSFHPRKPLTLYTS
jgi:hypothetical protein